MNMKGYVFVLTLIALMAIIMFSVFGCKSAGTIADYGFGASVDTPIGEFKVEKEKANEDSN